MAMGMRLQHSTCNLGKCTQSTPARVVARVTVSSRVSRASLSVKAQVSQQSDGKTIVVGNKRGKEDLPYPWSEKDPYKLPVTIDKVQRLLLGLGWEKPWVEQIVDRIMKAMLKTSDERLKGVVDYLASLGLRQDEICNMACISVVLLGLNPETRLKPVTEYLLSRGVPANSIPDLVLKHPRIYEYKVDVDSKVLTKGGARIKVDILPHPSGQTVASVSYYRVGTSFLEAPVSPMPPSDF
jgi:hypothetical protein